MPTAPSWIHLNITQTHWRNDWYVQKKVFSFAFLLEQGSLVSAEFIFARVRGCIYYYPANREMRFYFNHVETQRLCFSLRILGITFPPPTLLVLVSCRAVSWLQSTSGHHLSLEVVVGDGTASRLFHWSVCPKVGWKSSCNVCKFRLRRCRLVIFADNSFI